MRRLTRRQRIAATVLALVALAFVSLDVAGGRLRAAHNGVSGSFGALYRGTDTVLGPVRRFVQGVPTAGSNRSHIEALEQQNASLRASLAAQAADARSADELKTLQLAADSGGYRIVPARVLATGPGGGFEWTLTLDVGSGSGVLVGQTVTDGAAVVGRVLTVTGTTSTVLLAADPGSGVGVRDARSGQLAVATGAGSAGYTLVPLDPKSDLRAGDQLQSGPAGKSSYVAGLAVGTITAVHSSPDGSTRASVRPAVSPTKLDLVGVIQVGGTPASRAPLTPAAPASPSPSASSTPLAGPR